MKYAETSGKDQNNLFKFTSNLMCSSTSVNSLHFASDALLVDKFSAFCMKKTTNLESNIMQICPVRICFRPAAAVEVKEIIVKNCIDTFLIAIINKVGTRKGRSGKLLTHIKLSFYF